MREFKVGDKVILDNDYMFGVMQAIEEDEGHEPMFGEIWVVTDIVDDELHLTLEDPVYDLEIGPVSPDMVARRLTEADVRRREMDESQVMAALRAAEALGVMSGEIEGALNQSRHEAGESYESGYMVRSLERAALNQPAVLQAASLIHLATIAGSLARIERLLEEVANNLK